MPGWTYRPRRGGKLTLLNLRELHCAREWQA
jgi:hypothetical protein